MAYGVPLNVYNEFNILLPEQDKLLPNANEKESDCDDWIRESQTTAKKTPMYYKRDTDETLGR